MVKIDYVCEKCGKSVFYTGESMPDADMVTFCKVFACDGRLKEIEPSQPNTPPTQSYSREDCLDRIVALEKRLLDDKLHRLTEMRNALEVKLQKRQLKPYHHILSPHIRCDLPTNCEKTQLENAILNLTPAELIDELESFADTKNVGTHLRNHFLWKCVKVVFGNREKGRETNED